MHWIQFYKETQYDRNGREIQGGSALEGHITDFGEWYLDATPPPPGTRPTPDTIYYDNPGAKNSYARNKTNLSIFDQSVGSDLEDSKAARGAVNFKTYLTDGKILLWEVTWDQVTTPGPSGERIVSTRNFRSRQASAVAPELNTPKWSVGYRADVEKGTVSEKPTEFRNPFAK